MNPNNSETSITSSRDKELEQHLKDLLERILVQLEKYIETKDDLNQIEHELKDYENLTNLVGIIKVIFQSLINKVEIKINKMEREIEPANSCRSCRPEDEYEKLEQIIQRHESEIRQHIRLEQQLKLYAESIQQKLDESEQTRIEFLENTKCIINNLKRDNQKLTEQQKHLQIENDKMKSDMKSRHESLKHSIEQSQDNSTIDYHIQQLSRQSQQVKGLVKKKPLTDNRQGNSFSEHKLSHQFEVHQSDDFPTQSQGSIRQNYMNLIQYGAHQDTIKTNTSEKPRMYGQPIIKSKNNSISTIQEVIHNVSLRDKSKNYLNSYTASKNSSQNISYQNKQRESCITQQRSRSGSARRNPINSIPKQKTDSLYIQRNK